jgi:hypothetical protein
MAGAAAAATPALATGWRSIIIAAAERSCCWGMLSGVKGAGQSQLRADESEEATACAKQPTTLKLVFDFIRIAAFNFDNSKQNLVRHIDPAMGS